MASTNIKAQMTTTSATTKPTIICNSELFLLMEVELLATVTTKSSAVDPSTDELVYFWMVDEGDGSDSEDSK